MFCYDNNNDELSYMYMRKMLVEPWASSWRRRAMAHDLGQK